MSRAEQRFLRVSEVAPTYIYMACARAGGIASDGRYEEKFPHPTSDPNGDAVRKRKEKKPE